MFFHDCGADKVRKTLICSTSHKKRCAGGVFTGDMYKTVEKLCKNLFDRPT